MGVMGVTGLLAAAALLLAPTAIVPMAAAATQDDCTWRQASVLLEQELASAPASDTRAAKLRALLADDGVGRQGFLPADCTAPPPSGANAAAGDAGAGSGPAAGSADAGAAAGQAGTSHCASTAAAAYGWGTPNREDEFTDPSSTKNWSLYDGPGHAGNGIRSPHAASVADGQLTITGDDQGTSEGMAWNPGQKYGRWEGCVASPKGASAYNSLLLLWPDAENFPVGGEIDFMEISDQSRQSVDMFLHYGQSNSQVQGTVKIDATQWHSWAVEWTPDHVTAFVDGKPWYTTNDASILPPGPMHLCIQLDYFPHGHSAAGGATEHVDWVRQYPLTSSGAPATGQSSGPGSG